MPVGELINTTPCSGPGPCTLAYRSLWGQCGDSNSTLAGSDNMIAWMNAYDMSQIPWGVTRVPVFNTYASLTPDTISDEFDGGHPFSRTDIYYNEDNPPVVSPTSDIFRSQIWLGAPRAYLVIAAGFVAGTGQQIAVEGCTFAPPANSACGSLMVELPIPAAALGYYCREYLFALVGPNPTGGATGYYPDLATFSADILSDHGVNWNPAQTCAPGNGDPFA